MKRSPAIIILCMIIVAAAWPESAVQRFAYRGEGRWCGPWDSPNTFGLVMGFGFILALGLLASADGKAMRVARWSLAAALGFLAVALIKSYSRGAWVGTLTALLCYLLWWWGSCRTHRAVRIKAGVTVIVGVLALNVVALSLYRMSQAEMLIPRRVGSILNPHDFSWINRLTSMEGVLQMIADKPLIGFGSASISAVFAALYLPEPLSEGAIITTNSYLHLTAAFGMPSLTALLALAVVRGSSIFLSDLGSVEFRGVMFFASAVVLLVGFAFDGGLFEPPTAMLVSVGLCLCDSLQKDILRHAA